MATSLPNKSNDLAVYATTLNNQLEGDSNVVNNGEEVAQNMPVKVKNSWDVFSDFWVRTLF